MSTESKETRIDRKVASIKEVDLTGMQLPCVNVYYNPKDYPKQFVARISDVDKPTDVVMVKDTLEEITKDIRENTNFVFFPRDSKDHPSVVGTWF